MHPDSLDGLADDWLSAVRCSLGRRLVPKSALFNNSLATGAFLVHDRLGFLVCFLPQHRESTSTPC